MKREPSGRPWLRSPTLLYNIWRSKQVQLNQVQDGWWLAQKPNIWSAYTRNSIFGVSLGSNFNDCLIFEKGWNFWFSKTKLQLKFESKITPQILFLVGQKKLIIDTWSLFCFHWQLFYKNQNYKNVPKQKDIKK